MPGDDGPQHSFGIGHLRNLFGRDERSRFDLAQASGNERLDQFDLFLGGAKTGSDCNPSRGLTSIIVTRFGKFIVRSPTLKTAATLRFPPRRESP